MNEQEILKIGRNMTRHEKEQIPYEEYLAAAIASAKKDGIDMSTMKRRLNELIEAQSMKELGYE